MDDSCLAEDVWQHVAYLLFSKINGGEEVDALATQAHITSQYNSQDNIVEEVGRK